MSKQQEGGGGISSIERVLLVVFRRHLISSIERVL